jgi:hypothetical protein
MLGNPSWKVIVSASHGQYLKPGSLESGFFLQYTRGDPLARAPRRQSSSANDHESLHGSLVGKTSVPGISDRRAIDRDTRRSLKSRLG